MSGLFLAIIQNIHKHYIAGITCGSRIFPSWPASPVFKIFKDIKKYYNIGVTCGSRIFPSWPPWPASTSSGSSASSSLSSTWKKLLFFGFFICAKNPGSSAELKQIPKLLTGSRTVPLLPLSGLEKSKCQKTNNLHISKIKQIAHRKWN